MNTRTRFFVLVILLIAAFVLPMAAFAEEHKAEVSPQDAKKPPSEAMKTIDKMKFDPIEVKIPVVGKDVERVELKNGMILYLKEDHRFPVVNIFGTIRTGEAYETKDRFGVARLTGNVMRTGGTRNLTPEQLNRELEVMATTIESGIGDERGSIYLSSISSQADKSMKLFSEVLRYPAFNEKEMELAKAEIKEELLRSNDNYRDIGRREYYKILYPTYVMGWEYDWNFVKTVKKDDLQAWHKRFYHPNNMMFAVVGDFKRDEMLKKFNELFGDWKPEKVDYSGLQTVTEQFKPGVYYVNKDVDQSAIRMGHLGVTRNNPDRYALEVMNFILGGGGFNSYLMGKVRSDEGLAYSVGSYLALNDRVYGPFNAASSTRSDATVRATILMREQIERIRQEPVKQENLEWAKNSIINSFVFEFDDPFKQVDKLLSLEYDGNPQDFYQTYLDNIRIVTPEDVQRVAQKYLHPDKLTFVIVGNIEKLDKPLKELGAEPKEIKLENPVKE